MYVRPRHGGGELTRRVGKDSVPRSASDLCPAHEGHTDLTHICELEGQVSSWVMALGLYLWGSPAKYVSPQSSQVSQLNATLPVLLTRSECK